MSTLIATNGTSLGSLVMDAELLELLHILEEVGDGPTFAAAGIGSRFPDARQLLVITSTDMPALGRAVETAGGRVLGMKGSVATVEVPLSAIGRIAATDGILEVRLSRVLSSKLDRALKMSGIETYRQAVAPAGRGRGVIIGIVDSGIDGSHPAFVDRIVECWNQVDVATGPGVPYGILERSHETTDEDGHGTHVAGIAVGVAPEAMLLCVKSDLEDAHVIDAVRYIFDRASLLGMPAVVNLSLGGHGDPHDGTDALSRAIDEESGPGKIVVAAAGNEGLDNIHFVRAIESGTTHVAFRVPFHSTRVVVNLWYDGAGDLEVAVSAPFGTSTAYQSQLATGQATQTYTLASLARVYITTPGPSLVNGDKSIRIALQTSSTLINSMIQPGRWFIHLRNHGAPVTVHGWTIDDSPWGDATWVEPSNSHLIGSPGAAASAITAVAMISRNAWTTEDGSTWSLKFDLDTVAPTSSRGPLRNGGEKPDYAVAGGMIIAPRSAQATFDVDGPIDLQHAAMAGTSMATAVLTGMCAVLLESHPEWGPPEMREKLKSGSRGTYSPDDGLGLVRLDLCS